MCSQDLMAYNSCTTIRKRGFTLPQYKPLIAFARNYKGNSPYRGFTGKLRRYKFYGLHIRETWKVERICAVAAVLVAVVVMAGKVFWASWEVVFGAGSFFVAVPMLILAVLSYYE